MVRVSNGLQRQRSHKAYMKQTKGFKLGRGSVYMQARTALIRKGEHEYKSRIAKKRDFRNLWIERLSAAAKMRGGNYSTFIAAMDKKGILLNRKVLSNIALAFPAVFDKIYTAVKA